MTNILIWFRGEDHLDHTSYNYHANGTTKRSKLKLKSAHRHFRNIPTQLKKCNDIRLKSISQFFLLLEVNLVVTIFS